jgi:hypothetical protein
MNVGDPQSFNRYCFVLNQPTSYVDPSGLLEDGEACDYRGIGSDGNPIYLGTIRNGQCVSNAGPAVEIPWWWDIFFISSTNFPVFQTPTDRTPGGGSSSGNQEPDCIESSSIFSNVNDVLGNANDGVGGAGKGMQQQGGRFRLGTSKSQISPRHYQSDYARGNAYMTTRSMTSVGLKIANVTGKINLLQAGIDVGTAAYEEGRVGPRTVRAFAGAVGSYLGSAGGAFVGAALAVEGGPFAVLAGGFAGGAAGGAAGKHVATEVVHGIQDRNLPRGVRSCP